MLTIARRPVSIMVVYAIALHLSWAVIIWWDNIALAATGPSSLYQYIHPPGLLVFVLVVSSIMAIAGISLKFPWVVYLLIPQQLLLLGSAAGSIEAMWLGQFADGVLRPHAFIAADQLYSILGACGHTLAIIAHSRQKKISNS